LGEREKGGTLGSFISLGKKKKKVVCTLSRGKEKKIPSTEGGKRALTKKRKKK